MSASEDHEDEFLRPDLLYTMTRQRVHEDDEYDLEEEDDGFHCHNCGWRGVTLPMTEDSDDILKSICPECREEGVENKLSTHLDEIIDIHSSVDVDDGFVPYSHLANRFGPPQDRLDEALNHLITRDDAYVVFEDGTAQVHIDRD